MESTPNFVRSFKTSVSNGKSPWQTVQNLADRHCTTETKVWNCLKKAGVVYNKSFNGKTLWFPYDFGKCSRTTSKTTEFNFWWNAIEFSMQQGWVTPEQIYKWNNKQLCWFLCNKFGKFYGKPSGFNPNTKIPSFSVREITWGTKTTTGGTRTTGYKGGKTTTTGRKTTVRGRKTTTTRGRHTTTRTYKFGGRRSTGHGTTQRIRRAA